MLAHQSPQSLQIRLGLLELGFGLGLLRRQQGAIQDYQQRALSHPVALVIGQALNTAIHLIEDAYLTRGPQGPGAHQLQRQCPLAHRCYLHQMGRTRFRLGGGRRLGTTTTQQQRQPSGQKNSFAKLHASILNQPRPAQR